jgi:ATP-dependent Lon protease
VFFIATANQLGPIPGAASRPDGDHFLAGYSDREKLNIAKQYLVPRQITENGLKPEQFEITEGADQSFDIAIYARSRRSAA